MKGNKLTSMALLTAIALTMFLVEAQIPPPIPVAGVKPVSYTHLRAHET